MAERVEHRWGVRGSLSQVVAEGRNPVYTLKYGKLAAKVILKECYYQNTFALERKAKLAAECIATSVGWSKSGTVGDENHWRGWQYKHVWSDRTTSRVLDSHAQFSCKEDFILSCR